MKQDEIEVEDCGCKSSRRVAHGDTDELHAHVRDVSEFTNLDEHRINARHPPDERGRQEADGALIQVRANSPRVPSVLSEDPGDPDFVFERNSWERPGIVRTGREIKEENDLIQSLPDRLADELETFLDERRRDIRREWAIRNGRDWDPRPDVGVFEIEGQVWRWKDNRPPLALNSVIPDDPPNYGDASPPTIMSDGCSSAPQPVSLEDLNITMGPMAQIVGTDNRKLISALTGYNMTSVPWRWIGPGLQEGTGYSWDRFTCTGGKIYDRIVVMNGHCLGGGDGVAGWTAGADYLGYKNGVALGYHGYPYKWEAAVAVTAHPKWVDHYWDRWDIAVVILPNAWWVRTAGHFGVSSNDLLHNHDVNCYGYPSGSCVAALPYEAAPHLPKGTCGGSLYGMKGRVVWAWHHTFDHNCDTGTGQSGSPMFRNYYVVGVNKGSSSIGIGSKLNRAVRIEVHKHHWLQTFRDKFKWSVAGAVTNEGMVVQAP